MSSRPAPVNRVMLPRVQLLFDNLSAARAVTDREVAVLHYAVRKPSPFGGRCRLRRRMRAKPYPSLRGRVANAVRRVGVGFQKWYLIALIRHGKGSRATFPHRWGKAYDRAYVIGDSSESFFCGKTYPLYRLRMTRFSHRLRMETYDNFPRKSGGVRCRILYFRQNSFKNTKVFNEEF